LLGQGFLSLDKVFPDGLVDEPVIPPPTSMLLSAAVVFALWNLLVANYMFLFLTASPLLSDKVCVEELKIPLLSINGEMIG
jgi:hypothetical protein